MSKGEAKEFNVFENQTFSCIRALTVAHISMIEMCCIPRNKETRPRSMNTDTVECTFGNKRQLFGESHNKLAVLGFDRGDTKSNANCKLVGNNNTEDTFFKQEKLH